MKTQNISPAFTGIITVPNKGNNKNVKLLYNKVIKIVNANQATTDFNTNRIGISAQGNQEKRIKYGLKQLGINFFNPEARHVYELADKRLFGKKNYSPALYSNFRQTVSNNNGGITVGDDSFFVNVPKIKANAVRKKFNELGLRFSETIKDAKKVAGIIVEENENLR